MAYRSNVPAIAEFTFQHRDPEFPRRAKEWGGGFIVAGHNYGQGSSREHAALAPAQLGVRAVIAKSFARIHRRNLIAQGIVPLLFKDEADYDKAELGQTWRISGFQEIARGRRRPGVRDRRGRFDHGHARPAPARARDRRRRRTDSLLQARADGLAFLSGRRVRKPRKRPPDPPFVLAVLLAALVAGCGGSSKSSPARRGSALRRRLRAQARRRWPLGGDRGRRQRGAEADDA